MLKNFRTLVPYLKKYLSHYIIGFVFLVATDLSQILIPQLVRRAIDAIAFGNSTSSTILNLTVLIMGAALVIAVGRFCWRFFIQGASRRIEKELREQLFGHLQSLSTTYYGRTKTGDLMARFTNDMHAIRMATGMAFVAFVDGVFMTIAILIILISQNPRLALISITPLPVITIGAIFFGRVVGERFRRVQEGFSRLSELVQESISGIRVLKTFVREPAFVRRFSGLNLDYSRHNMDLVRIWGLFFPAVSFLSGLTSFIFLFLGGRAVLEGNLSPGTFTAFFAYLRMLTGPMMGAGFTISLIQRAGASLGRINSILDEIPDITSPSGALTQDIRGDIRIQNLSYTYPDTDTLVLKDINLDIPAGSSLGILGRTASGKTSLARLLPRILDPPEGTIFIDGQDIRAYALKTLRAAFGLVPQDNFLFSSSIRENIAFGSRNEDPALVDRVVQISTIDRDLANFPDGLETVVGERGITLSGGQKQRVCISRALATRAAIYILDDSLSSVDTETEAIILRELMPFIQGKTVILISHRISTIKLADNIIVLDQGQIVQQGSHAELIAEIGFYAEIYKLQQLEETMRKKT